MFHNGTSDLVEQELHRQLEQLEDAMRREIDQVIAEQGRPLWVRVGSRFKNNELTVMVAYSKDKPGNSRTFSHGFTEGPWVRHEAA